MRIVGGAFGGRRLASVGRGDAKAALRPTTDRLRESLFNVLEGGRYGDPVADAHVLDLFAGTGALGLEALSRGAATCTFVENGRAALSILRQNIGLCAVTVRANVVAQDARMLTRAPEHPARLVFLDPPYGRGLGALALTKARTTGWISRGALVLWEEEAPQSAPDGFALREVRRYGSTSFTFLEVLAL
ncbi:MAG: 16S rRNA (guanine(966)-N(2))-methyltransferase RsmD [Pseudomonadota bacterium]